MKAAIRRELGLYGIVVSNDEITIDDDANPPAENSAISGYREVTVGNLGSAHFYIVDDVRKLLIMNEPTDGERVLTVYNGTEEYFTGWEPVTITIPPITSGKNLCLWAVCRLCNGYVARNRA
jgi:hypothetical protein